MQISRTRPTTPIKPTLIVIACHLRCRADSTIEIWDLRYAPHMQQVIPGSADGSVEAMVWCNKRLFSTGLHGTITEYNLLTLSAKVRKMSGVGKLDY